MASELNKGYMTGFQNEVQAILKSQSQPLQKAREIRKEYDKLLNAIKLYNGENNYNSSKQFISPQVIGIIMKIFDVLIQKNGALRDAYIDNFLKTVIKNNISYLDNLIPMIK